MSVTTNRLHSLPAMPTGRLATITTWLGWALIPALALATYLALFFAPTEETMGHVYRIFFFHMPSAIACFVLFFINFVASIAYLRQQRREWDVWATAAAEVGILAALIAIGTGSIWARPIWNTWWTWDPRLTTTTIMTLSYVAYLMLRGALDDPARRARYAAVLGIMSFINVPLVYFSSRWFRTIHPVLFAGSNPEAQGDMALTDPMHMTLRICMLVVMATFIFLLFRRVQLEQFADEIEAAKLATEEV
jgi:heme exporter protein C